MEETSTALFVISSRAPNFLPRLSIRATVTRHAWQEMAGFELGLKNCNLPFLNA